MVAVQLLGHFVIRYGDVAVHVGSQPLRELLCYLLVHRGRGRSREVLASELWGERSTVQSLKTLRQALWQLTKFFESVPGFSFCDRDFLQLELHEAVTLDVALLDRVAPLLDAVKLTPDDLTQLQEAAAVYRGDLLEDWQQEWCLIERERYRALYLALLDTLTQASLAQQETKSALHYAYRALELEPWRECTHRQLMELYLLRGDRTAALRQFGRCARLLREEYRVEPSAATLAVYRRAREEGEVSGDEMSGSEVPGGEVSGLKLGHAGELKLMFSQVLDLLHDIKRDLEAYKKR